jgi:tRNA nucleotidyltransferase (CCA-adding enzyme)
MTAEEINLESLAQKLFPVLKKEGFQVIQMAIWNDFAEGNMLIEELYGDETCGYHATIGPEYFATSYELKPKLFTKLEVQIHRSGIFVRRKDKNHLLNDPPIRQVGLNYLPKHKREQ